MESAPVSTAVMPTVSPMPSLNRQRRPADITPQRGVELELEVDIGIYQSFFHPSSLEQKSG